MKWEAVMRVLAALADHADAARLAEAFGLDKEPR